MPTQSKKPIGSFSHVLAIDCETTGLCFNGDTPVYNSKTKEQHQTLSWGVIVADADTLMSIEEVYVEIKWNINSIVQQRTNLNFGKAAEKIHGLSRSYLEINGVSEEAAALAIGELIFKYWGSTGNIKTLGHNVHLFDLPFLKDLFVRQDIHLNFGNRHIDTSSAGFVTVNSFTSDSLFNTMGLEKRELHNSLDDAKMALESARRIRLMWDKFVNVKAQ